MDLADFLIGAKLLTPHSSNVQSFLYDASQAILWVTYKPHHPKTARRRKKPPAHNYQGSYYYLNVSPDEATSAVLSASRGKWVWSYLRVRGSATAHRKRFGRGQFTPSLESKRASVKKLGPLFQALGQQAFPIK
jgi:hypothetical protein